MLAILLLQVSLLARPLYLDPEPPELRSARALVVLDAQSGAPGNSGLEPEEALRHAERLRARALAGEDFEELVRRHSNAANAAAGGALGSVTPGVLAEPLDRFLFAAEVGEVSPPIVMEGAVYLVERVETLAAVRQIEVAGTGEASLAAARELLAELEAGADFAELARARSADAASAARGGDFAIYERGRRDALLKAAAFRARVGELVGPLRSAQGYHVLQRVPLDAVDPALREPGFARLRAILVAHEGAVGSPDAARSLPEAQALAESLHARVAAGEDMAALAREWNDDPGGRERAGDLGWVHRQNPDLPRLFDRGFLLQPGELAPLQRSTAGYILLRRER